MAGGLVAVAQKALVGGIAADHKPVGKLRQMLRGVRGHVVGNDHLIAYILCVLQNGHQAGIGVSDLVIHRNHNGHLGSLLVLKPQIPVLPVNIPDLKVPFPQIPPFLRGVQLPGADRMEDGFLLVSQLLALDRPSGILLVEPVPQPSADLGKDGFMAV